MELLKEEIEEILIKQEDVEEQTDLVLPKEENQDQDVSENPTFVIKEEPFSCSQTTEACTQTTVQST